MEAAHICAERGHEVVLFEASARLGGQMLLAGKPDWRRNILGIADWLEREIDRLGVSVRLNHFAEREDILKKAPDVVFIATSGLPHTDMVEGNASVLSSWDVMSGIASLDGEVLFHDQSCRNVAMAAADHLAAGGVSVTLNTQDTTIGMEAMRLEISPFMKRFYQHGVAIQTGQELVSAESANNKIEATFRNMHTGSLSRQLFDHVVVEAGTLPNDELFYALVEEEAKRGVTDLDTMRDGRAQPLTDEDGYCLHRIGDVAGSRDIHCAILDALRICANI